MMRRFLLCAITVCLLGAPTLAGTMVRMETVMGNIDIELYDAQTPITAANFLNYVNDGDYTNTFIHRSVPGFVIQGGGFTLWDQVYPVPADAPIVNEWGILNTRGTIAMARQTGLDSATSQWFINVDDNTSLDNPANPYAVFGHVLGDGMEVADAIAALETFPYNSPFGELPLIDYAWDDFVNQVPLVRDNFVVLPTTFVLQPGDATCDGDVNLSDLGILATNWGQSGMVGVDHGDFNYDRQINLTDLGILATNWGTTAAAVPEPASLSLLAAGALGWVRRRR